MKFCYCFLVFEELRGTPKLDCWPAADLACFFDDMVTAMLELAIANRPY